MAIHEVPLPEDDQTFESIKARDDISFLKDCLEDDTLTIRLNIHCSNTSDSGTLTCGWHINPRVGKHLPNISELAKAVSGTLMPAVYNYLESRRDEDEEEETAEERKEALLREFLGLLEKIAKEGLEE